MKKKLLTLLLSLVAISVFAQLDSLFESFDSTDNMPTGWSNLVNSANTAADVYVHTSEFDAYSGTNFVKMHGTIETDSEVIALITPELTNPADNQLNFFTKSSWGDSTDLLIVGTMTDPSDYSTFSEVASFSLSSDYEPKTVSFPTDTTDNYIAFLHGPTVDLPYAVYLDDISWEASDIIPNPAEAVYPTNVAINVNLEYSTMNMATNLEWSPNGGNPTNYIVSFGTSNPPTDIMDHVDLGSITAYELSTVLDYSTTYFWQVIPVNEIGQAEDCPVWTFNTMADPTIDFAVVNSYEEGFESAEVGFLPLGMEQENIGDDNAQWSAIANSEWSENSHTGQQCVHMAFGFMGANNDWLYTAPLNLIAGNNYTLSFWYKCAQFEDSSEKMAIHIGDDASSESMGEILWSNENITNLEYELVEIEYTATETRIKFFSWHNYSNELEYVLFVDDVQISEVENSIVTEDLTLVVEGLRNYPNPFNPTTTIEYQLKTSDNVSLEIYNAKGQLVNQLVNEIQEVGLHNVVWTGTDSRGSSLTSGVYFYKISSGTFTSTKKMILLK